ncbi:helix-turn-helix domain-containing protein [Chloroflexota bacterium]
MILKTKIFVLIDHKYQNLSELAQAMGISVSQVYRVRAGKRNINQKFITGAKRAFPEYRLDDLFYLAIDSSPGIASGINVIEHHRHMAQQYTKAPSQMA